MSLRKRNGLKFEKYVFWLLIAVQLIMSFTFLGYIHVPPISVTTAFIPIVAAACLFGTREATLSGLIFGLGSMYKASALYVQAGDSLFSPVHSSDPLGSLILSVGTRTLFGFLTGLLFTWAKKQKHAKAWKGIFALTASQLHTFLVYGAMGIFFPEAGFSYESAFRLQWDYGQMAIVCFVCVMLLDTVYHCKYVENCKEAINQTEADAGWSTHIRMGVGAVAVFVLSMSLLSTFYYSDRMNYMLRAYGVENSLRTQYGILHLQVQFLAATLALNLILLLVIIMVYRYMKYKEYRGQIDSLTSVMGRRLFLNYCNKVQAEAEKKQGAEGWFLFLDVDWFKRINDTLGHSTGDETLHRVAEILKSTFKGFGETGRMGGDEFAVIIDKEMSREELEARLKQFLEDISGILPQMKVSCSIGACRFAFPKPIKELLTQTDDVLYQAKENGKACFVIRDHVTDEEQKSAKA